MTDTRATDARAHRITLLQQTPLLVVLVLLWMMLWGSLTPLTIVTGIVVAFVVTRVFYLPAVELSGRFNPLWFLVFLGRFFGELVIASFTVAAQAVAPRRVSSNAVIGVHLATRSDFIMTITAISLSLIPGSIVVEVDRARGIVYLHTLGVSSPAAVEKARDNALLTEARLVRAFGSRDDLERVKR